MSVEERAECVGVTGSFQLVSPELRASSMSSDSEVKCAAKKRLREIQKHNLQIVARAEKKPHTQLELQASHHLQRQYLPVWTFRGEPECVDELGFTPAGLARMKQIARNLTPGDSQSYTIF